MVSPVWVDHLRQPNVSDEPVARPGLLEGRVGRGNDLSPTLLLQLSHQAVKTPIQEHLDPVIVALQHS